MNGIISSASKIVFVMMAVGVNLALFYGKITGEQYMVLAGMTFTFYFTHKGEKNATDGQIPFAGK